jgi:hypothetical protein
MKAGNACKSVARSVSSKKRVHDLIPSPLNAKKGKSAATNAYSLICHEQLEQEEGYCITSMLF